MGNTTMCTLTCADDIDTCSIDVEHLRGVGIVRICAEGSTYLDVTDERCASSLTEDEIKAALAEFALAGGSIEGRVFWQMACECCQDCGQRAEERECEVCGETAIVIDCGHYAQPCAIAALGNGPLLCDACHKLAELAKALDDELPDEGQSGLIASASEDGDGIQLSDDWATCILTIEQAEQLKSVLRSTDVTDPRFTCEWVWEWTDIQGIKAT